MNIFEYDERKLQEEMNVLGVKVPVMIDVLLKRVRAMPLAYLEFSVYWWALKGIFARHGHNLGSEDNELMRKQYTLSNDALTLFAAYQAAEYVRGCYFYGTHEVAITDDGEDVYSLFDKDIEQNSYNNDKTA